MLGFMKRKSRLFRAIEYLAERKSRSKVSELRLSFSRRVRELNEGAIETIEIFRRQYEEQLAFVRGEATRSGNEIRHAADREVAAIRNESVKIQADLHDSIKQISKEMSRLGKCERAYEDSFSSIIDELDKMLPQVRVALQTIQAAATAIEERVEKTKEDVGKLRKSIGADDIVRKNRLRARR